ncbi:WbqC family protein [Enterobacter ludwigii]|uniref:WbqC family protein n=1 Tax=Enterobacter TaxID=547 RepID=UPI00059AC3E3|nr:WbqC family protein [Enterobacter ludwigii]MDR6399660.1 hypothetical protein [Enterobacter ludwigii]WPL51639.1 WbqC family protein [Enterobacter ludwigii]CZU91060.1 WbqC-like family protein [Enterobacter ludwigii]HDT3269047.1 WbqC family protein [Enterobacter ludwigii]
MSIAIMQPYLFPWIGYFQLVWQSDVFVLYDDARYIKQGYINRNSILSCGKAQRFTLPVPGASINKNISELAFSKQVDKILKSVKQNYQKAPHFEEVFALIEGVLTCSERDITTCCSKAISDIFFYLGEEKKLMRSSSLNYKRSENAENKVISICQTLGATKYVNSIGGRQLYDAQNFARAGIELKFLQTQSHYYHQGQDGFIPNLSIIDVLMHCEPIMVKKLLTKFEHVG